MSPQADHLPVANNAEPTAFPPVSVNGIGISESQIAQEMQHFPADTLQGAYTQAARALVVRALLLQEAGRRGFGGETGGPEEAAIQKLLDADLELPEVDEETCRRYYEQNQSRFCSEALFEAAHILIPAPASDEERRASARLKANEIAQTLAARPERFESLAREYSACPSSKNGGVLGQIGPGRTAPQFERALGSMSAGEITMKPVETRYGFHIIKLIRSAPGRLLPFPLVRERIVEYLTTRAWTEAVHQYVLLLAGGARIQGIDIESATTPLVQ